MSSTIPDWLAHRAAVLPQHAALISAEGGLTYAHLDHRVLALAGTLCAAGVHPGDRLGALMSNSVEMVEAIHAVSRVGAILVLLNMRLTADELTWQLRDADVSLLLCHWATEPAARSAAADASVAAPLVVPVPYVSASDLSRAHDLDAVHSIIYTSGTTGRPKGAMLTYGNFAASADASAVNLGVTPGDRWLACMPLFHVGGLSIVLRSAIYGTTVVLQPGFEERSVMQALHEQSITHISVVASMLQRMLDADDRRSPPSLRVVLVGGGPVPISLLERALDRGFPVIQTYGLTEAASQVATLSPSEAVAHIGSAGEALFGTRVRIDAPPGEAGEILVKGPTVTPGYFRNEAATAAAIQNGWLRTGDVGRLDQDGFLFVLDRRDDLIVTGGENVYPAEVEDVLLSVPGVQEAAVVGLPDEHWGQLVAAALVVDATFDEPALKVFLADRLAGYKRPRQIQIVPKLPKTASGKIQRRLIRDLLTGASKGNRD